MHGKELGVRIQIPETRPAFIHDFRHLQHIPTNGRASVLSDKPCPGHLAEVYEGPLEGDLGLEPRC